MCVYLEEIWDAAIIDQTKGIGSWSEQSAGRFLEAVIQSVAPSSLQHPGPEFHASFFFVSGTQKVSSVKCTKCGTGTSFP